MDFKDTVLQLAERIKKQKDAITTEEGTKNAFIMPMIAALGYDIFNPFEVVPELDCDLIKKKGEKIDYAIMKDNESIILMECKHCKQDLHLHDTQLQKYFVASKARFGVLTNGIEYRFYTDLDKPNIMDGRPFLVLNLLDLSDADIEQLKNFHKSYFSETGILSTAQELKYITEIKKIISEDFNSPSEQYVRFVTKQVYTGQAVTSNIVQQFTPLIKKAILSIINDTIKDRLNIAINSEEKGEEEVVQPKEQPDSEDVSDGIVTTQEEIDSFNIIRSILRKDISAEKIIYQDYKSYFVVAFEKPSCWICRLSLKPSSKRIGFPSEDKKTCEWEQIESLDDIFNYADKLSTSLKSFLK